MPRKSRPFKGKPKVSVIVAVWNGDSSIERCINSILKQSYPRKKMDIIVVGGGTDDTPKICKRLAKEKKITYLLEKERQGKWFALNRAVKQSKNEILGFIDSDCVADKNWLESLVLNMNSGDILVSDYRSLSRKSVWEKTVSLFVFFFFGSMLNLGRVVKVPVFFGIGSLIKRKVFRQVKFEKSYVEDWIFSYRASSKGFKIAPVRTSIVHTQIPKSTIDFRKAMLRVFHGFYEMLSLKDTTTALFLIFPLIVSISIPFYLFQIVILDPLTLRITFVSIIITFLYMLVNSIKRNAHIYFLYTPLLFIGIPLFIYYGFESLIRFSTKSPIGWPIYKKAG